MAAQRLRLFQWTAFMVVSLALVLEVVNGRFWLNDLRVYVMAAEALRHGDPVYGVAFGLDTGFYKYAPGVLYFFLPYTLVPYPVACVLHFALIGAASIAVILRMERILMRHVFRVHAPHMGLRAFLAFLCVVVHLARELHLGNVTMLLLWCMVIGLEALLDERPQAAGAWLGAAVLVKPYLALGLLPLVAAGRSKALAPMLLVAATGLLLPLIIEGPTAGWSLTDQWIRAMSTHDSYLSSPHTLRSLLGTATGVALSPGWDPGFIALAAGHVIQSTRRRSQSMGTGPALVHGSSLALAWVPLLVVTDVQHFLLALPLITWCIATRFRHPSPIGAAGLMACMVAYGTASTDLWGPALAERLNQAGAVGWGTLGLILLSTLPERPTTRA